MAPVPLQQPHALDGDAAESKEKMELEEGGPVQGSRDLRRAVAALSEEAQLDERVGDVLDADRTLVNSERQYIESLSAYHKTLTTLEGLVGQSPAAMHD